MKGTGLVKAMKGMLILLPLLAVSCELFQVKEPAYYSPNERSILERTTQALDFGYGYDAEVELNYLYSISSAEMSPERREKEFMSAVKEISSDDLSAFFDTMYRLNSMTRYKIYRYGKTGKWKYYTYLNNYLLPPLDAFCKLLQKQLTARIPDFEAKLQKRKARIDREVVRYYYLLEMEEFRKDFYY